MIHPPEGANGDEVQEIVTARSPDEQHAVVVEGTLEVEHLGIEALRFPEIPREERDVTQAHARTVSRDSGRRRRIRGST